MQSYLRNRINYVFYSGYRSEAYTSGSGVPQGSNLGPLLFILFIDDLLTSLHSPALCYADDLKIYSNISAPGDAVSLQNDLDLLYHWCIENKLVLNIPKCCFMTYSRKLLTFEYPYEINGQLLSKVNLVKDLGVLFDPRLSFNDHIASLCLSASKTLGFIMRSSKYFSDISLIKTLYYSFVVSKLEYCSVTWSPNYISYQLSIEKLQRRFLKFLTFKLEGVYPPRGTDYPLLLQSHNMQSLTARRDFHAARFVWKLVNNKIDSPLLLSQLNFSIPRASSRYVVTFALPTPRTNALLHSPIYNMSRIANNLYGDIFNDTINHFQK